MRITLLALASLCVVAAGCHEAEKKEKPEGNHTVGNASTTSTTSEQTETNADRQTSDSIRKALANHPTLGSTVRSIKITTREGVVTLRGAVGSNKDKQDVVLLVSKQPGVKKVESYLEVTPKY